MKSKLIRLPDHGTAYLYTSLEAMMRGTKYGLLLQSPDTKAPKFDLVYGGGSHFIPVSYTHLTLPTICSV